MSDMKVGEISSKGFEVVERLCRVYFLHGFYMAQSLRKGGIDIAEITDEMVEEMTNEYIRRDFEDYDA